MNIIKLNKKTWTIPEADGIIYSGYNGFGLGMRFSRIEYNERENIIFGARIRPTSVSRGQSSALVLFEDADGKHNYEASLKGMYQIVRAFIDGNLSSSEGYIDGVWTFRKMGTTTSIWPVDGDLNEYKDAR